MASQAAVTRVLYLFFQNGAINEATLLSNSTFQAIIGLTINSRAQIAYIDAEFWNVGVFTFAPALEVTLVSTSANDATIVTDLPALQSSLNLTTATIPTYSYTSTWSY